MTPGRTPSAGKATRDGKAQGDRSPSPSPVQPDTVGPEEDDPRRRIVDAASIIFREHGLVGARTRELAQAAGVTQATLFRHFKTKEDIFIAAVLEPLEALISQILLDVDRLNDVDERTRIRTFLNEMERQLALTTDLAPLLGVGLFSDPKLGRKFYNERLWPLFQRWAGATESELRKWPHRDVDPVVIILTIWGMSYGLSVDSMVSGEPFDARARARWLGELMYRGIDSTDLPTPVPPQGQRKAAVRERR